MGADETTALNDGALRSLSDMLDGDPEALRELVDAFIEEAPQRLAELRGDSSQAERAAHTLKSNALTFGATRLGDLCLEFETRARADDLAATPRLGAEIEAEWGRVAPALDALRAQELP